MLLAHGTIVALVDGENLTLLRNTGNEAEPVLSELPTPAIDGHVKTSGAWHGRTASNPSGKQLAEDGHAAGVVAWLNHEVLEHRIKDLVVVAPPHTLGEMRRHYHGELAKVLRHELPKELGGRSGPEIIAALRSK